jgi:selenocysteine lyase/cysteine desulfurase
LHQRGGTISFSLEDSEGKRLDYRRVEALANKANISLRTGCFCNPGTGEIVHKLTREEMAQVFNQATPMSFEYFFDWASRMHNRSPSTIRISLGIASNFADVYRFMGFLQSLLDRPAAEINALEIEPSAHDSIRDSA